MRIQYENLEDQRTALEAVSKLKRGILIRHEETIYEAKKLKNIDGSEDWYVCSYFYACASHDCAARVLSIDVIDNWEMFAKMHVNKDRFYLTADQAKEELSRGKHIITHDYRYFVGYIENAPECMEDIEYVFECKRSNPRDGVYINGELESFKFESETKYGIEWYQDEYK